MSTVDLDTIVLEKGSHARREDGVCVMELAAWLAGREHSDRPPCVSSTIGAFLRNWNDNLDKEHRQMLKPYAALVLNTATGKRDEEKRAWLATDWLVREFAPAWLDRAGLTEHAKKLRALPESAGAAAGAVAWAAAGAWDAAGDAAWASALGLLDRMIAVGK